MAKNINKKLETDISRLYEKGIMEYADKLIIENDIKGLKKLLKTLEKRG
jgi:hypothetical protein